jgi:hypothetical protein
MAACDKFIFYEVLCRSLEDAARQQVDDLPNLRGFLVHAAIETSRDNGWASLSAVGSFINTKVTSFDARKLRFHQAARACA